MYSTRTIYMSSLIKTLPVNLTVLATAYALIGGLPATLRHDVYGTTVQLVQVSTTI